MKIAIITDTHFGAKGDSQIFLEHTFKFFEDVFFPTIKEQGITNVLHLGDLMDRRKYVNFHTLHQMRTRFMDRLLAEKVNVHCIVGNHDTYFKNTNEVNSPKELFGDKYPNFHIYTDPVILGLGNKNFAMVPWINKENQDDIYDWIKNVDAPILCGHFELDGYQVMRNVKHTGGQDPKICDRFDRVWSGHFHQKHEENNVCYFGTAYQMTFADLFEKKGFHIYDTETDEIEFVENPHRIFFAIPYRDNIDIDAIDYKQYKKSYVKIFVHEKKDPAKFDRMLERIYDQAPESVTFLENEANDPVDDATIDEEALSTDTLTLINQHVDEAFRDDPDECKRLKEVFKDLFLESFDL